ncbi:MAG TPA: hypothetical protein VHV50_06720 [Actinomycetota bacterium]|nr:hypothetical protein [Actinomycetota bacterium]
MKRSMGGGSYRGPVGIVRQRRTIRFVQICLVVIAAALLMLAGYSLGRVKGFDEGRAATRVGAPAAPSAAKTVVIAVLGLGALGAAVLLQGQGGVRLPVPARLEELTGRAESTAIERAETVPEGPA